MPNVTLANPLPAWAILLVLAGLAAVAWFAYAGLPASRRRNALAALRFATLALLCLFLLRPIRSTDDGLRDAIVPILVDSSRSMAIDDAGGRRRIDRARDIVETTLGVVLKSRDDIDAVRGDVLASLVARAAAR